MKLTETKYQFLIQQYKNNVYSYALYMMKNRMDAEDISQEVMIRIWQNVGKFNILSAKTWIMKTTHNLCIDYLRKRQSSYSREYRIDEEFSESFADGLEENNPLTKTHLKMMTDKIKIAIQNLPDKLKGVFVLYEIQGMKYREISKALEMPLNTVKVNILRARKKLRNIRRADGEHNLHGLW
jgi:RNA polymerase sigma-70 factor (ECF subfamily)